VRVVFNLKTVNKSIDCDDVALAKGTISQNAPKHTPSYPNTFLRRLGKLAAVRFLDPNPSLSMSIPNALLICCTIL
jgi:hypothetical protein